MNILLFILIIILIQIIINQQELDYHIIEQNEKHSFDSFKDGIMNRGLINKIIWYARIIYHNIIGE